MTVNGELNKLANNVSFGHGILDGDPLAQRHRLLHPTRRGSRYQHLQDRALTYAEPFTVNLTKIDGTIATISNQ